MEEKNNKSVKPISLSAIEPIDSTNVVGRRGYVSYGRNDKYLDKLYDLYVSSPTNNAIITTVSQLVYGEGLVVNGGDLSKQIMLDKILPPKDVKQISFDMKLYGYAVMFITLKNKKVHKIKHSSSTKWRSGVEDENNEVTEWYYSPDWDKYQYAKNKPTPYPLYDRYSNEEHQVYILRPFIGSGDYYPDVDYKGALNYIQMEKELGVFHVSNISNGLFPSTLINFNNGIPTEEAQDLIERNIKMKWGGANNAGRFMLSFNDDKDSATTIEPIEQADLDKMFEFMSKEATQKIMIGHRVTSPIMFGVRDGGGLGNNADELAQSFYWFSKTSIKPMQNVITDSIEEIMLKNNVILDLEFEPLSVVEPSEDVEIADGQALPKEAPMLSKVISKEELTDASNYSEDVYMTLYVPLNEKSHPMTKGGFTKDEVIMLSDLDEDENIFGYKKHIYLRKEDNE